MKKYDFIMIVVKACLDLKFVFSSYIAKVLQTPTLSKFDISCSAS